MHVLAGASISATGVQVSPAGLNIAPTGIQLGPRGVMVRVRSKKTLQERIVIVLIEVQKQRQPESLLIRAARRKMSRLITMITLQIWVHIKMNENTGNSNSNKHLKNVFNSNNNGQSSSSEPVVTQQPAFPFQTLGEVLSVGRICLSVHFHGFLTCESFPFI
jgi:hypothetical protein